MTITLFYSPHMTSVDNEAGRASGHADIPLSARGKQEAERLGQQYAQEAVDVVFCSDLQRATVTAQIAFSARNVPIILDARLRECDYGEWTQRPRTEIKFEEHITEPFPGGESIVMVARRVRDFLQYVLENYDGKRVVVIAHAAAKYALEYWSGDASLEEVIAVPWEWLDVPIWRYEFTLPLRKSNFAQNEFAS
ncbi:MAG: histidine phosphatase family protein [Chloroflexota bacterium]